MFEMKELSQILRTLKKSKYLEYSIKKNSITSLKILENGRSVRKNLIQEWVLKKETVDTTFFVKNENKYLEIDKQIFVHSDEFYSNLYKAKEATLLNYPLVIKQQVNWISPKFEEPQIRLISDFLFDYFCGLEKFYTIQRQRKIWWMTMFSDPSLFSICPCDDSDDKGGIQAVEIKSLFPFKNHNFETISFVHLKDFFNENHNFLPYVHSNKNVSLIRSVIDLESAVCALLLDACSNIRHETMYLHHKLVPYQCAVTGCYDGSYLGDLEDLNVHITEVIENSGIRIYSKKCSKINICNLELESELNAFDQLGIPYVIILEDESLKNGLLKLRNRDTLLKETIHISDLPSYMKFLLR